MANTNTIRGGYPPGTMSQFPAYSASQYYPVTQAQYQAYSYPYYTPPGMPPQTAHHPQTPQRVPPPPPPPPPGESASISSSTSSSMNSQSAVTSASQLASSTTSVLGMGGAYPPLERPPLPPLFPWMTQALAQSMTGSPYGQKFKEEASNLPFVPILVNDADLQKMTEKLIKEAEEETNQQMKFYKDVISQDLPKPLLDMFQPLYCKLCILTLSSPIVAKDHYNGKRHKKAIELWFSKNPNYSNQPSSSGLIKPINGFVTPTQIPQQNTAKPPATSASAAPLQPRKGHQGQASNFQQSNNDRKRPLTALTQQSPPTPQGHPPPRHNSPGINQQQQQQPNQNQPNFPKPPQSASANVGMGGPPQGKKAKWDGPPAQQQVPVQTQGKNNSGSERVKQPGQGGGGGPPPKERCELCNVQLSSKVMAEQHFRGKNHASRLAAKRAEQSGSSSVPVPSPTPSQPSPSSGPALPSLLSQQLPSPGGCMPMASTSSFSPSPQQKPPQQQQQQQNNLNLNNFFNSSPSPSHRGGGGGNNSRGGGGGGNNSRGGGGRGGSRPPFKSNNNSNNFQNNNNRFVNNKRGGGPRFK